MNEYCMEQVRAKLGHQYTFELYMLLFVQIINKQFIIGIEKNFTRSKLRMIAWET